MAEALQLVQLARSLGSEGQLLQVLARCVVCFAGVGQVTIAPFAMLRCSRDPGKRHAGLQLGF